MADRMETNCRRNANGYDSAQHGCPPPSSSGPWARCPATRTFGCREVFSLGKRNDGARRQLPLRIASDYSKEPG